MHLTINILQKTYFLGNVVKNKIIACVTDNAANEVAAIRLCQWRHLGCFAHTLNVVVQQSMMEISPTAIKVNTIIEYFKSST